MMTFVLTCKQEVVSKSCNMRTRHGNKRKEHTTAQTQHPCLKTPSYIRPLLHFFSPTDTHWQNLHTDKSEQKGSPRYRVTFILWGRKALVLFLAYMQEERKSFEAQLEKHDFTSAKLSHKFSAQEVLQPLSLINSTLVTLLLISIFSHRFPLLPTIKFGQAIGGKIQKNCVILNLSTLLC